MDSVEDKWPWPFGFCPCLCGPPDLDEPASTSYTKMVQSRLRLGLTCLMTDKNLGHWKSKQNRTNSSDQISIHYNNVINQRLVWLLIRSCEETEPETADSGYSGPPSEHGYLLWKALWSPKDLTVSLFQGALHRLPSSSSYFKHFLRMWALLPLFALSKPHLSG